MRLVLLLNFYLTNLNEISDTQLHNHYGYYDTKIVKLCTISLTLLLFEATVLIDTVVNYGSKNVTKSECMTQERCHLNKVTSFF